MTLSASIKLFDGMSPALRHMNNALNIVISSFESMQRVSEKAVDTSAIRTAREELAQAGAAFQGIEESVERANRRQQEFNGSMRQGRSAAGGLLGTLKQIAGAYLGMQGARGLVNLSDQMASTKARLNLMVDDGGSVAELEQKIMASALRSRSAYQDTASAVAKLGLNAGNAFQNNDETIRFMEQVNKLFVIGGASAQEQSNAMIQLTQAMAAGALRGEELNSILDGAPGIARAIEQYMGIAEGSIKSAAAEGQVTAQVVKNALFAAADETNARFESMPKTWGQIWTEFTNRALTAFQPVLEKINQIANSERFQRVLSGAASALATLGGIAAGVFDFLVSAGAAVYDNWSWLAPIVLGVAGALAVYYGAQLAANAVNLISHGIHVAMAAAKMAQLAVTGGLTAATAAETAAQYGLNAAMYACPLTWIVIAIIAVIAVIYAAVAAFNHFAGASVSATGIICGVVAVAAAVIGNIVIGLLNGLIQHVWSLFVEPFIGIIEWVLNAANGGFNSFGGAVANLIGQIISWFLSLGKVVTKIIDAIFGTDWTSGLNALQSKVTAWGKNDSAITLSREAPAITTRFGYGDAWSAGNDFGRGLEDKVKGLFGAPGLPEARDPSAEVRNTWEALENGVGDTAGNTGRMADAMELSGEDLKYLRDIAERDAVNQFTTAEIKVDLGGVQNNVNSNLDLDGVVSYLEEAIYESMSVAAEGVHI